MRKIQFLILTSLFFIIFLVPNVAKAGIDLSNWEKQANPIYGNWDFYGDNNEFVVQRVNGYPTFFVSPNNFINGTINGSFKVRKWAGDDDFIGFVFGYKSPIRSNDDNYIDYDFYLFNWRKYSSGGYNNDVYTVVGEGYNLVRVNGIIPEGREYREGFPDYNTYFWHHADTGPDGVFDVLDTKYGNEYGWDHDIKYYFELRYESDRVRIYISTDETIEESELIFDQSGTFQPGRFGFYNNSQKLVEYGDFTSKGDPPVANNDNYSINKNEILLTTTGNGVSSNDESSILGELTAEIMSNVSNGTLTFNNNGTFTYTPNVDFFGTDSFTYKVYDGQNYSNIATTTITINNNNAPVITEGNIVEVEMSRNNEPISFDLVLNATDADDDDLTWSVFSQATNGSANVNGMGVQMRIYYTPNNNWYGNDSFFVQVSDGNGGVDVIEIRVDVHEIDLKAVYDFDEQISVMWTDDDDIFYEIERRTDTGNGFGSYIQFFSSNVSFPDNATNNPSDLPQSNKRYQYRIATSTIGDNINYVYDPNYVYTTPAPPTASTSVVSTSTITWNWVDNAAFEESYKLSYINGATGDFNLNVNTTSFYSEGLAPNSEYRIRVRSHRDDRGESSSVLISAYTLSNPPINLSATTIDDDIVIAWGPNSNPSYTKYQLVLENESVVVATTSWIATTTFIASPTWQSTNIECGVEYNFKVRARNENNIETEFSNYDNVEIECPPPPLPPPPPPPQAGTRTSGTQTNTGSTNTQTCIKRYTEHIPQTIVRSMNNSSIFKELFNKQTDSCVLWERESKSSITASENFRLVNHNFQDTQTVVLDINDISLVKEVKLVVTKDNMQNLASSSPELGQIKASIKNRKHNAAQTDSRMVLNAGTKFDIFEVEVFVGDTEIKRFDHPIILSFDVENVPNKENLGLYYWNELSNTWLPTEQEGILEENILTIELNHLTIFTLMPKQTTSSGNNASSGSPTAASIARGRQLEQILTEAIIVFESRFNMPQLLEHTSRPRSAQGEYDFMNKYSKPIIGNYLDGDASSTKSINNFIFYGTQSTRILGAGERAGVVNSYKKAFGKLPRNIPDWRDVIAIGNGRWPNETSAGAEDKAKVKFIEVYTRPANMENQNDNAAVTIIAYGLRPNDRNLNSEIVAIKSFNYIYDYFPVSALDWDIVRAIAYSGATREGTGTETKQVCKISEEFSQTMRAGTYSEEVKKLQTLLKCIGYFDKNFEPTTYYGSITQRQVKQYQADNGLSYTGIVGEATRNLLNKYLFSE